MPVDARLAANALLFAGTGIILWATHGHSNDIGLFALTLLWLLAVLARARPTTVTTYRLAMAAYLWVVVCAILWAVGRPLIYAEHNAATAAIRWVSTGIVALGLFAISRRRSAPRTSVLAFAACSALALVVLALVLPASPKPQIDVFVNATAAVDHLLAGRNPYSQTYGDIYNGRYDYPAAILYWPAILLAEAVARATVHDIRAINVLALLLSVVVSRDIVKRAGVNGPLGAALVTLWIVFPVGPFVIEQAWVDPLLVATFAAIAWALLAGNGLMLAVAMGASFALKQYALWGVVLTLVYAWRTLGFRKTALSAVGAFALFAATIVPFALLDAKNLYYMTIFLPAQISMRPDALSLLPMLEGYIHNPWPAVINAAAGLGGLLTAIYLIHLRSKPRLSDWTAGLVFTYGLFFLFSKQAFCNYYYLFAYLVWLQVTVCLGESAAATAGATAPAERSAA